MTRSLKLPAETLLVLRARAELERRRRLTNPTGTTWRTDFSVFATLLDIIPREGVPRKLRPNAIQSAFNVSRTGRDIVLKPRQVGLTTWELARDIWFFLTRPGARVVVVCQSMSDDGAIREIAEKLRVMFASLAALGIGVGVENGTITKWSLPSTKASLRVIGAGASEAAASKKGRSGTIHRLHITELAFFEFARETVNAMFECVPGPEYGTEIVIESTANGAAGLFYELYGAAKSGRSSLNPHFFSWLEQQEYRAQLAEGERMAPDTDREREVVGKYRATSEQLKWYRGKVADKGQDLVDQEYPTDEQTCWLTAGRLFFDMERTKTLLGLSREPIEVREVGREGSRGKLRIWEPFATGRTYIIVVDPSEGVGGDPGAAVVYDRESAAHVATVHGQFSTWEMARVVADLGREANGALVVVERNNHGHAVLQALIQSIHYKNVYQGRDAKPGWLNNEVSRAAALEAFFDAHRESKWSSPDADSLGEMLRFVVNAKGKAEAAAGAHDDLVIAHTIAWFVLSRPVVKTTAPPLIAANFQSGGSF
jgi:hypothetical protein